MAGQLCLPSCHYLGRMSMSVTLDCYILLSSNFKMESVEQALTFLQTHAIHATFLGLHTRSFQNIQASTNGAAKTGTRLLGDASEQPLPNGLLIAGGSDCGQQMLADPRVHHLVQQMRQAAKPVGFLYPVSAILADMLGRRNITRPFLFQDRRKTAEFMQTFLQQMQNQAHNTV